MANGYPGTIDGYYSESMVEVRMNRGGIVIDENDGGIVKIENEE